MEIDEVSDQKSDIQHAQGRKVPKSHDMAQLNYFSTATKPLVKAITLHNIAFTLCSQTDVLHVFSK